ncbi:hypothetical protein DJ82_03780 [Halorubrum sp. Ib24]|uniref:DUF5789 family protein n=1 Tax=unclassified Halorubrum TaxID=2642239 RepID=UPI000B98406A|nr:MULTISPECIES: hypothetical protein [unclassified Halorubrum]OYR42001.1 hypothetical protein DJ82_03780 [Halorubrum sp. Ib24]OYR54726.1 hypothetical protein DJ73_04310 [Halorubrum sp. Ea1]
MADDKAGREDQARDEENRQRRRDVDAELERGDEPEPELDTADLGEVEPELERLEFPVTGAEIVSTIGDREVASPTERYTVEQLVPDTDRVVFDSPDRVRVQIRRPTVAAAMKRIVETSEALPNEELDGSQYDAYERTFQELERVSPDDEDEAIAEIRDWVVERVREKGALPASRGVRRQPAKVARREGHQIRNSDWLGI